MGDRTPDLWSIHIWYVPSSYLSFVLEMQRLVYFSPTSVSCTQYIQFIYIFSFLGIKELSREIMKGEFKEGNKIEDTEYRFRKTKEGKNNREKIMPPLNLSMERELRGNRASVCSRRCWLHEARLDISSCLGWCWVSHAPRVAAHWKTTSSTCWGRARLQLREG